MYSIVWKTSFKPLQRHLNKALCIVYFFRRGDRGKNNVHKALFKSLLKAFKKDLVFPYNTVLWHHLSLNRLGYSAQFKRQGTPRISNGCQNKFLTGLFAISDFWEELEGGLLDVFKLFFDQFSVNFW